MILKQHISRGMFVVSCLLSTVTMSSFATADCPLKYSPFSIDMPVSDVFRSSAAKEVLQRYAPDLGKGLSANFGGTELPPPFANIMSPRILLQIEGVKLSAEQLQALEHELQNVPVTAEDQQLRCQRYDNERIELPATIQHPAILVFEKITGFRDEPSVNAAQVAIKNLAKQNNWQLVFSDKAGVFNLEDLAKFDAIIWNNVSGDALTLTQRAAFKRYLQQGGGYVGIHGSAGDPAYFWDWYPDELISARFIGHPSEPQFQTARVQLESHQPLLSHKLDANWSLNEEWYSFAQSPRVKGAHIIASLDETSYSPVGFGHSLAMGDHPIAWAKCMGPARVFYTAIGHLPEVYADKNSLQLLENGIEWSLNLDNLPCQESLTQ